jgi:hypothetical protein
MKKEISVMISKSVWQEEDSITNMNEIQRIIREYFKNLYSNKLENLEEMDKFLDTYGQPKLSQEDINHLNRSISNETATAIKSLPKKTHAQDLMDSMLSSTRPLEKN